MVDLVKSTSPRELIARGAPKLFLTSAKDWKEKLVAWFETDPQGPRRKLYPAQVEQVLIDLLSYGFSLLGREAQFASEQRWLLFAVGQHLDVAAANNSTFRLKAQPATCRVRATLSAPALAQTLIGKAGDTLAAGTVVFRLDSAIVIAAGQTAGEAIATAQVPGVAGNGFLPGQVRGQIRLPGSGATGGAAASGLGNADLVNISETAGGTEEEGDEALRERAMNAHERISKAGPRESYRQQARAYSPAIADVAVIRPAPGQIHLFVLMSDGVPAPAFLDGLKSWLDPLQKRPQGDALSVFAAEAVTFSISGTGRAAGELSEARSRLEARLTEAAAIWSRKLGDYMALSALTCAARAVEGIADVDLDFAGLPGSGPAARQLAEHQFAVLTGVSLTMQAAGPAGGGSP